MSEFLRKGIIIDALDLKLYKYGFIKDVKNSVATRKTRIIQLLKFYALRIWILFNIIRYLFYLLKAKNGIVPMNYLDISQNIGMLPQFARINTFIILILTYSIIDMFSDQNLIYGQFFDIINFLKGTEARNKLRLQDVNELMNFKKKVKLIKAIVDYGVPLINLSLSFLCLTSIALKYYPDFLLEGILSAIIFCSMGFFIVMVVFNGFLYYFIVCYYCKIRLKVFNRTLVDLDSGKLLRNLSTIAILSDSNYCCSEVILHNKVWRKYYFTLTYVLIPLNLVLLHQIIFATVPFATLSFMIIFLIGALIAHYILNLLTASLNKEVSKSYKLLMKYYYKNNRQLNSNLKIKV
jgi:hypothetical protein